MEPGEQILEKILKRHQEEIRQELRAVSQEFQRHVGALAEGLESKIQLVAESVLGIREIVVKNSEDLEKMKERNDDLTVLEARVTRIEQTRRSR